MWKQEFQKTNICNPAQGSNGGTPVYVFLSSHVFGEAAKHHTKRKWSYNKSEITNISKCLEWEDYFLLYNQ